MKIFLDIETIPDQTPGALESIMKTITPPGNIKKQETIDAWMAENASVKAEEVWRATALDGAKGEVFAIGWAFDNEEPYCKVRKLGHSDVCSHEQDLIDIFFDSLNRRCYGVKQLFIGHNIVDFDLRFIYHRAVILGIKPPIDFPINSRHGCSDVFDTMTQWAGYRNRISLKNLCSSLNIPVKSDGIDGSKVWDAAKEGEFERIAKYCKEDVEATREVYNRLTFGGGNEHQLRVA